MGFQFRRSIRILPGLRLNVGRRGPSVSIGVRGAHVTVGHGQVRETVSLPGTGLSYTHAEPTHRKTAGDVPGAAHPPAITNVPPQSQPPRLRGAVLRVLVFLLMLVVAARIAMSLS